MISSKAFRVVLTTSILLSSIVGVYAQGYTFEREVSGLSQSPSYTQFHGLSDAITDSQGNVFISDIYQNRIYKYNSAGVLLQVIGLPSTNDNGLGKPFAMAIDANDNLYVADQQNYKVVKYSNTGVIITTWGHYGTSGNGMFASLNGIAVSPNGRVYVSEANRIQVFTPEGLYVKKYDVSILTNGPALGQIDIDQKGNIYATYGDYIASIEGTTGYANIIVTSGSYDGSVMTPSDVTVDGSGNIYVADNGNSRVQKFTFYGTFISKLGSGGTADGQFTAMAGIDVDINGNLYVVDGSANKVQKFDANGSFISKIGNSLTVPPSEIGYGNDVAVNETTGDMYVVDSDNNRVMIFNGSGAYISSFGTLGSGNGQFNFPQNIAITSSGNLLVTDMLNHRVQRFTSAGIYISQFGSNGTDDGQFLYPCGITVDASDNIYVVGSGNGVIQKFNSGGVFILKFGNGIGFFSLVETLVNPTGITLDNSGNIFIADYGNDRVASFNSTGDYIQMIANAYGQNVNPTGVAIDKNNSLHVASSSGKINVYTVGGTLIGSWRNQSPLTNLPCGIKASSSGKIYITEPDNKRVLVYAQTPKLGVKYNTSSIPITKYDLNLNDVAYFSSNMYNGSSVDPITITITNTQPGTTLTLGTISLLGINPGDFSIDQSSLVTSLAYGVSTTFKINNIPSAIPGERRATVQITSNDLSAPVFTFQVFRETYKYYQTLTLGSINDKTYGDPDFQLYINNPENQPLAVYGSPDGIVTITGDNVSIDNAYDNVSITVEQEGNAQYYPAKQSQSFSIARARLDVIADDVTINEGDNIPTLPYHYAGFVYNEDESVLIGGPIVPSTYATNTSPAGQYPINVYWTLYTFNYSLYFHSGTLTILPITSVKNGNSSSIGLYPNPSTGDFQIESSEKIEYVILTNSLGNEEKFYSDHINTKMKGLVMVQVVTEKSEYKSKIVIE